MNAELSIAKDAAIEAGGLILSYYKADYEIKDKGYHNPVTTADHAADARLKEILTGNYPNYGWLSEETVDSKERLERDRVWVVDPLDGTKEFIEGVPHFAEKSTWSIDRAGVTRVLALHASECARMQPVRARCMLA